MMKKTRPVVLAILSVLLFAGALYYFWSQYESFLSQGQKPPEEARLLNLIEKDGIPVTQFTTIDGKRIALEQFKDKLVILNFWASWCDPCVAEFPSLIRLLEKFQGQIVMIAVSGDYEEVEIRNFLKLFKVNSDQIHVVWDQNLDIAKKFGTYKLPESYIIGANGKLIRKVSGVDDWSSKDAFEYFAHLLSQK